jgi:hypothetical protein
MVGGTVMVVVLFFLFRCLRRFFCSELGVCFCLFFLAPLPVFFLPPLGPFAWTSPMPNVASNANPAAPRPPRMLRRSPVLARALSDCSKRLSSRPELMLVGTPSTLNNDSLQVALGVFALPSRLLGYGNAPDAIQGTDVFSVGAYICVNF